jgi:siderophore synthetase component
MAHSDAAFEQRLPELGRLSLRELRIPDDLPLVHTWVTRDSARYWGMVGYSLEQVTVAYVELARRSRVFLGFHEAQAAFLVETYDPARDAIGEHYGVLPGDRGMHVLVAPPSAPIHGFTWAVFNTVMEFVFSDPHTRRVIVEPDIRNAKIHALNRRAGFRYQKIVHLPHKIAHLAFCTRAQYRAATEEKRAPSTSRSAIEHLEAQAWDRANRELVCKAIAECAHELLLEPELERLEGERGSYRLVAPGGEEYRFRARRLPLDHWDIDGSSLEKSFEGASLSIDAVELVLEFQKQLGISTALLPVYLEEVLSTLYSRAYTRACQRLSAADLVHAGFQEIESAMRDGHPAFIANSGRVGFDAADYLAYAPEVSRPVHLVWLAASRERAEFTCVPELTYAELLRQELGEETLDAFEAELGAHGLRASDYVFIPVHPWQWQNRIAQLFAADIATRHLVCLGVGPDTYTAQQSIRTFFNHTHPEKHYVKTALSVLNMGFMRGLSADYMQSTPAINEWLHALVTNDAYFARRGFRLLREVAGVGYRNPCFEAGLPKQSAHRKMLAALWRESPVPRLRPGQRLMSMAALLHRDRDGAALLPQLIAASGLDTERWLERYLDGYLGPLLHFFFAYDLAFMPHGENVILLLEGNVPHGVFLKDLAEEVVLMETSRVLPPKVQRIAASIPESIQPLSIFTDVFDGVLRYIAQILLEQSAFPVEHFWQCVAECVFRYQREAPQYSEKFRRHDLFCADFPRSCLNRLQLTNNLQMVDLSDPAQALQIAGTLRNPIAASAGKAG